jgi:hypothetical protein
MHLASTVDLGPVLVDPVLWAAFALGVGLFLFYRGFGLLRRRRLILNTPRSTVRGAALGTVEVSGKAAGPYTLISPLSALNCYYYRARAWQNQQRRWKKVAEETLCAPLFLDDGTGRLLVDPGRAELDLPAAFSHEYSDSVFSSELIPDYISHFLRRHAIAGDSPLKLEECCILPGDTLFVLGTLEENPRRLEAGTRPPTSDARRAAPGFVSQEVADLERRGELESLDVSAGDPMAARPSENPQEPFDLEPPVLLRKGSSPDPFFISWCSQREVALTLEWRVFLYLWCGPILTLAGLWVLSESFTRR